MPVIAEVQDLATGGKLDVRLSEIRPVDFLKNLGAIAEGADASVPCGDCQACCWYGRVDVKPAEEKLEDLDRLRLLQDEKGFYLAKREDGGCVHLGKHGGGCAVWEHRPKVCRQFDCRVFGLAGLAPMSHGHAAPVWEFPMETPLDRAIVMAGRIAGLPYMDAAKNGKPDPPGNVLVNVLKGVYEALPFARRVIAQYDRMEPEQQRDFEIQLQKDYMEANNNANGNQQ